MANKTKLKQGEDGEIQMQIGVSMPKDIIYTLTPSPLFHRMDLKLVCYEFITNSTAAEGTSRTLKIKLSNKDLLKTFDLKKRQEIWCFMTLNEGDKQFKYICK